MAWGNKTAALKGGGAVLINAWRPQPSAVREQGGADSASAAG